MSVLQTVHLSKAFGGNHAVEDVSLTIEKAELVALVGPNGAGKTTLLNLVTGQQTPTSGSVQVNGIDVTRRQPSHRDRAPLFRSYQDGGTFPRLSALENVAVAAVARGKRRGRAERDAAEALRRVGLWPVAHERTERLSGGQRKLIDFARCLAVDAQLALFDEPTAGVNPALAELMGQVLLEKQATGVTCVTISHDLPWVFGLCPRVVVMAAGRVLLDGTPQECQSDQRVIDAYLS